MDQLPEVTFDWKGIIHVRKKHVLAAEDQPKLNDSDVAGGVMQALCR